MKRLPILVAAILLAGASWTFAAKPGDAHADLMRIDAEWSQVSSEGRDVEKILSYWSEDAIVYPPASPSVAGKAAIREFVKKSLQTPGFGISWKTTDVVVAKSGDLAYTMDTNRITVNGPDGKQMVIPGKGVAIWRREKDGSWKCVVDIWNDSPAPK